MLQFEGKSKAGNLAWHIPYPIIDLIDLQNAREFSSGQNKLVSCGSHYIEGLCGSSGDCDISWDIDPIVTLTLHMDYRGAFKSSDIEWWTSNEERHIILFPLDPSGSLVSSRLKQQL